MLGDFGEFIIYGWTYSIDGVKLIRGGILIKLATL